MGWNSYWVQWAVQNILPNPAWWLLVIVPGAIFRKRILAWWHRHFGVRAELADIRATADAARRIAADLFEHHTGRAHPAAPGRIALDPGDDEKGRL